MDVDPVGDPFPPAAATDSMLADVDLPEPAGGLARAGLDGDALLRLSAPTRSGRPRILPGLGDDEIIEGDPLRNRPAGPSGPTARMTLFGHAGEGRSFVFLIDRSKSMGRHGLGAIAAAERELLRELENLKPDHKFQIIAYNQGLRAISRKEMLDASEENKQLAHRFMRETVAAGSTEHEPALTAALRLKPDVVFLLTDGGEPLLSAPEIDLLTRENGRRTVIHCLQFGSGPLQEEDNFLAQLAQRNGGGYGYIDMMGTRR